jgi:hypothetical protein
MRFLRNRFVSKFLSVLFLILIVESTMHATISFALTTPGPHQPEYMSYEESGSPDLVNLVTGDFTFSIPLLDVPGPDGNFSVPLTYNAGIGLDQEASWVGLGFNVNVGAITRQISQYPDDVSGMSQLVAVKSPGVRGWSASILNFGSIGWNTLKGFNGAFSIGGMVNFSYDGSGEDFNLKGIQSLDTESLVSQVLSVYSIATKPVPGKTRLGNFAEKLAWDVGVKALNPSFSIGNVGGSSGASGYFPYSQETKSGFLNLWTDYWIWLDNTRTENMYGVLNLDAAFNNSAEDNLVQTATNSSAAQSTKLFFNGKHTRLINGAYKEIDVGSTTDVNYYMTPNKDYREISSAALLATDNYSVNAPGISGSIKPFRFDVGSAAVARNMYANQSRYNSLPFTSYKVPFVYANSTTNSYVYPTGDQSLSNFGLQFTGTFSSTNNVHSGIFGLSDPSFGSQRVRQDVQAQNYKIAQSNHIEYLTNSEIYNTTASFPNHFMDYFTGTQRQSFRSPYRYEAAYQGPIPSKTIGGYSITGANGITYHFALPIFEYMSGTTVTSVANPGNSSSISRDGAIAGTWLLTGITGPDFVDRDNNGKIDETDWGYWVKFNYGQMQNSLGPLAFSWTNSFGSGILDPTGTVRSLSAGLRQSYYLNSIETRSHVALFMKDVRQDNRGSNDAVSLSLKEIALLTRDDYRKLVDVYGLSDDSGTISSWWNVNSFYPTTGNTAAGIFVIGQALRRIQFVQSYDLCPGTTNSMASNKAKLTLTSLKMIGKNGIQVTPDYKFEYGLDPSFTTNYWNNPAYEENKWDGWGMYNSNGTSDHRSHGASKIGSDGSAWSLSKVISPMGSTIEVTYERDDYSSVSGSPIPTGDSFNSTVSCSSCSNYSGISTLPISNQFNKLGAGDLVRVTGNTSYTCYGGTSGGYSFSDDRIVLSATNSSVILAQNVGVNSNVCPTNTGVSYSYSVQRIIKRGGNIRVSSICTKDGSRTYKTLYQYRLDNGNSSGVVSQEPEFEQISSFDYNEIPKYPFTPVMYSKVTVLNGRLNDNLDFHTKNVYEFETPNLNLIEMNPDKIQYNGQPSNTGAWLLSVKRKIFDRTAKLGSINKITTFDRNGVTLKQITFGYTENLSNEQAIANQGYYSSSTLMHDRVYVPPSPGVGGGTTFKMTRTSEVKIPYVLQSITTLLPDGFTKTQTNLSWDFISGQVVQMKSTSPTGLKTKTVTKPAYNFYSSMGSKAININNKNMLGQVAASYTYQIDAVGNHIGLLGASAQTWKSDWTNYRYLSGTSFVEGTEGSPNVWRRYQDYVYKGSYSDLRTDGSLNFTTSQEFSFAAGATNAGWQKMGEVTRYDHYSAALEGKDLNNIFSSSKQDISARQVYANATNATYHEFAYSGAEDWDASGTGLFLGGEVAKGDGTRVSKRHTGQYGARVGLNGKAFIYKPASLTNNRVYRVSTWTSSLAGAIYFNLNNSGEQIVQPVSTKQVGTWYQINAEIPVGNFSSLEVGVKSTSGNVDFDDFRFQPRDGSLTANVYDPVTGAVTFVLDNQNMFTQYEYNDRGQLVKTYSESFLYGVKLVSESKVNYKGFNTN